MYTIWTIAKKELASFFDSLIAYVLLIAFLGFAGFFTWFSGNDIFLRGQADLRVFFVWAQIILLFFIPAITMRMISEEKKSGTIELLLTKAVSDGDLIIGKFTACLMLVGIALLFTLPYYYSVSQLGNFDHGAAITGYLGLLLMSAAYVGIGIFASSVTDNQIIAFLLAIVISIVFHWIFSAGAQVTTGLLGDVFSTLSASEHLTSITRGVIDTRDVLYFISLAALGILMSIVVIQKRN